MLHGDEYTKPTETAGLYGDEFIGPAATTKLDGDELIGPETATLDGDEFTESAKAAKLHGGEPTGLTTTARRHDGDGHARPQVWRSCDIGQVCEPPSAAEVEALCGGEDEFNARRYQLTEMLGFDNPGDDNEETCAKLPAVSVTDFQVTYYNMGKTAAFLSSKEKMICVDLAKPQESCVKTDPKIRRVIGGALPANRLAKSKTPYQRNMF